MKSADGGRHWENRGIILEDNQERMILRPYNTSKTFAGGVGDPSAVASGDYLYVFYGEYGYAGRYDEKRYDPQTEAAGQCISMARIRLSDLNAPAGKAFRWDGQGFNIPYDGIGKPIESLRISPKDGGGPTSSPSGGYYWGPSVSWNDYLNCWVMLMCQATGPSWAGSSVYIAFNPHRDLGAGQNAIAWSKPRLLLEKPGYFLWYPSLQPMNTPEDITGKNTCLKLGQRARLFVKSIKPEKSDYMSEHIIEFKRRR
jgi:hypothetical protein